MRKGEKHATGDKGSEKERNKRHRRDDRGVESETGSVEFRAKKR